jgi:serpin B
MNRTKALKYTCWACFSILIAFHAALCFAAEEKPTPAAEAVNEFGMDLYAELRSEEGNLFFSPYSVFAAMALVYPGAGGETEEQLRNSLHVPSEVRSLYEGLADLRKGLTDSSGTGGEILKVANALWGEKGMRFLTDYTSLIEKYFGEALRSIDFAGDPRKTAGIINQWVDEETQGKIRQVLSPGLIDAQTRLIITNAVYFKGPWLHPFKEELTTDEPFTLAGGSQVIVPMMQQTKRFGYLEREGFQVLEIPYAGERLSMIVVLPRDPEALERVEEALTMPDFAAWMAGLNRQTVSIFLPKFRVTSECSLKPVLENLGIADAFSVDKADFSNMVAENSVHLDEVVHKAFVEVNEQGTEAAAATAAILRKKNGDTDPVVFLADRPFI